jgi:hypothetical protein
MQRFKNQISSLTIKCVDKQTTSRDVNTHLFTHIFNTLINVQYLKFDSLLLYDQRMSSVYLPPVVFSSNLFELHVKVDSFGRFNQLRTFHVHILIFTSARRTSKGTLSLNVTNIYFIFFRKNYRVYDVFRCIVLRKYVCMIE